MAAGCIRTEPGGRVRLSAGDPGGIYLAFAEILAKRVRAHRMIELCRERRGTSIWAWLWPTLPSGIEPPTPR